MSSVDAELDDELQFHLEQQAAKYRRAGLAPEEASRRARLEFGGPGQIKEDCREAHGVAFLETMAQDVRYGLRMLRQSPGFTAVVVLTLGMGIGANTAIFSIVDAVLLRSLPVQNPERLVVLQWTAHRGPQNIGTSSYGDCTVVQTRNQDRNTGCSLSYPMFKEVRARKDLFINTTAFAGPWQMDLSGNGPASMAQGELVSGDYFSTLGVRPALGRTLQPEDDRPGSTSVAILDYGYWQRMFGGDAHVVGRTVRLNNAIFTIVGVADRSFTRLTPGKSVDVWVALNQATSLGFPWARGLDTSSWWLTVVGRLRPGVSAAQAQSAFNLLFVNQTLHGSKSVWKKTDDPTLALLPARSGLVGIRSQLAKPLELLTAAVGIVLLIACANVAGLMLARGRGREKELAVRLAIGAGRRRLIRQLLTESLLLSFLGAALGTMLAYAGAKGLAAFFAESSYSSLAIDLHPSVPVLLFTLCAATLTGIGFGLLPAIQGSRANVTSELKGNSLTITRIRPAGLRGFGWGSGLVMLQVVLSMVVLTGAVLLIRTLDKLRSIDPGFDTRNIILFSIEPSLAGYKSTEIMPLYQNLQRRLAALPGVSSVGYSSDALLDGSLWTESLRIEGQADKHTVDAQMMSVGSAYFTTMRIRLATGRVLGQADMAPDRRFAVVNESFVRRFVGARNPIGLHFGGDEPKDPKWEIVGVVGNTKYAGLRDADAPTAYVPLRDGGATFALRTNSAAAVLISAVRNVVGQVDSNLPVMRLRTQSETIDRLLFNERLLARLFGLFGVLGLVLACIGLYGLLSYDVALRTRELGIRTALGAQRLDMVLLVLRQGLALVIGGAFAGIGVAMAITRLLESLLYGVRPTDPVTFAAVGALLIIVGAVACFLPARRAVQSDPMIALRYE
jgi:predicted permease